jgi:FkbM family methyltransferase
MRNLLRSRVKTLLIDQSAQHARLGSRTYVATGLFETRMDLVRPYEQWMNKLYGAAIAAKGGAFIDVGANTGQTFIKLLSLDPERQYVGFEPQIDCSFYISQFILRNRLTRHVILPIGLSNEAGILELLKHHDRIDSTATTLKGFRPDDFYKWRDYISVAKGDDVLTQMEIDSVAVIKIDVEGAELEVLQGLEKTLERQRPTLFFEVLNHFLHTGGQNLDEEIIAFRDRRNGELMRLLRGAGYSVFGIRPGNKLVETLRFAPGRTDAADEVDYVAVHEQEREAFFAKAQGFTLHPHAEAALA